MRIGLKQFCIKYLPPRSLCLTPPISLAQSIVRYVLSTRQSSNSNRVTPQSHTFRDPFHYYSRQTRSITAIVRGIALQRKARFCGYVFSKSHDVFLTVYIYLIRVPIIYNYFIFKFKQINNILLYTKIYSLSPNQISNLVVYRIVIVYNILYTFLQRARSKIVG